MTKARRPASCLQPATRLRAASRVPYAVRLEPYAALSSPQHPHQPLTPFVAGATGAHHGLEHLAHLDELLEHAIDLLDARAAAASDALAAAAVDERVIAPLASGHRVDDCLDVRELLVVNLLARFLQLLDSPEAGNHAHDLL